MKIAIAGATGVLGRTLVPKLLADGHEIVALVRNVEKAGRVLRQSELATASNGSGNHLQFAECDLLGRGVEAKLATLIAGCEAVIHIATAIPKDMSSVEAWQQNTHIRIRGTGRLQRAALESGVTTFLVQSVVMAYPDGGDNWQDEKTWIDMSPERAHICHAVAILESMMRLFGRQSKPMRWSVLKGGMFVGPATFQDGLIERLRTGKEVVPCDGRHFISPVHVDDMAEAFVLALQRAPNASIFNICDEPIRYGNYVDTLADAIGAPHPRRDPQQPCPPSHRCTSQKAREVLGWSPRHSIYPVVRENVAQR